MSKVQRRPEETAVKLWDRGDHSQSLIVAKYKYLVSAISTSYIGFCVGVFFSLFNQILLGVCTSLILLQ